MRQKFLPYAQLMRLDKPVGIWLLYLPCCWGILAASPHTIRWDLLLWFGIGSVLMRSAGCVVNDLTDRKFDSHVARTATRPLASGALQPRDAFAVLLLLLLLSLLLVMQLRIEVFFWACLSLLLVFTYPWMKRITWWPQAFLGLTFNIGALMGWVAVHGAIAAPPVLLYIAGILWTLGYDTIYAHQDKEDDLRIGVKSTALKLGEYTRPAIAGFYTGMIALLFTAMWLVGLTTIQAGLLGAAAGHAFWQVWQLDIHNPTLCLRLFKSNVGLGVLVALAFGLAGTV